MKRPYLTTLLLTIWFVAWEAVARAAPFAYITNSGDDTVSVIDTGSNAVVATLPVGHAPYAVAANGMAGKVYVTTNDGVSVIDATTDRVIATVPVGRAAGAVAVNPAGTLVYVIGPMNSVAVIDAASDTLTASVPVGEGPAGVAVSPDGSRVYVTTTVVDRERMPCGEFGGQVAFCDIPLFVIDGTTNTAVGSVAVGDKLAGVAVGPDGRVYVANVFPDPTAAAIRPAVSVLNGANLFKLGKVPVGVVGTAFAVAVDPSGAHLYVTNAGIFGGLTLSVIDTQTLSVVATVDVGSDARGVAVTPDGRRVYVATQGDDSVAVVDTATNAVISRVAVGRGPVAFGQFIGPEIIGTSPTPTATVTPIATKTATATVAPAARSGGGCSMQSPRPGQPTETRQRILSPLLILLGLRRRSKATQLSLVTSPCPLPH